jgi:hypothetical protein
MGIESPTRESLRSARGRGVGALVSRRLEGAALRVHVRSLAGVLIAVGLVLRLVRFLHDRSLWLDESTLALNIMSRSYSHLFGALDFDQGAPVGFLVLEKLAVSVFGDSERAFRLFPFLAGMTSVVVFWRVALSFLDRHSALLALAFFAILEPFVFYSAETRPYAFDVLAALVLLWLFDRALASDRPGPFIAFALVGVVAPWFSYGSLFVLAGTGIATMLSAVAARNRRILALASAAIAVWLLVFAIEYLIAVRHLHHLASGVAGINAHPSSVVKNLYLIFSEPGAMPRTLIGLTVLLVVIGAVALARLSWRRLVALVVTLLAVIVAGAIRRYPVDARFILYLLALAVMLLALGAVSLLRSTRMPVKVVVAAAVAGLLVVPSWQALRNLVRLPNTESGTPATLQPTRAILSHLADQWRPGDILYISVKSQYAFRYYLTCKDCNQQRAREARLWPFELTAGPSQVSPAIVPERKSLVLGSSAIDLNLIIDDFQHLQGKPRVWFLFTHTPPVDVSTLEFWLNREGRELEAIRAGAAEALLFDLRHPSHQIATSPPHQSGR